MPEAWQGDAVSRSPSQGTMVTWVTRDIPYRMGTRTASPRGHFGERIPTLPC